MGTMGPVLWVLTALTLAHSLDMPARAMNLAHNDLVCSTWGSFHYKTFDGDVYQFPGTCNYLFASNCKDTFEDFNVQIRRSAGSGRPVVSNVVIKIIGLVIEMKRGVIMVGGDRVNLPYSQFGVQIQFSGVYVKMTSKLGVALLWNEDDSLTVYVPSKYSNSTCGLCGNMNGLTQDEFMVNNIQLTPMQFGNLQKLDGPTEQCEDFVPSAPKNCSDLKETCVHMLSNIAFGDCDLRLPQHPYIEACVSDLCQRRSSSDVQCICDTLSEYSRQCAHAGGKPQNWRTKTMCERTCPMNMKYNECGSPCADTCSNSERTLLCEEHCIDGCFCPPGTVLDDVDDRGCIPLSECSCTYNNKKFAPGEFYTSSCRNCTCQGGQWSCEALPCAGHCSLEGGSHIYTYDGGHYNFHGDCSYIFTKDCVRNMFTVLTELRKCGVSDTETCLKSITLSLDKGLTVLTVKSSGTVLLNGIYAHAPLVTENLAVLSPSSFFLVIQSFNGIQIQVQLIPIMQISVTLDPEYQGDACGLCGDFNNIRTDDFKSVSGALEGTAAVFANTWKSQADCNNVKDSYENPCALSVDNEKFAMYWCSHLSDSKGPFAPCHAAVNPIVYEKNCMYDSCNYEQSVDSVCAALAAYARACAAEGITLVGWRGALCEKYTKTCPKNSTYQYSVSTCQKTCRSLSEPDPSCSFHFPPLDGCACLDGTFLDDNGACVPAKNCPCYYKGSVMPRGEVTFDNGAMCTCQGGRLHCVGRTPSVAVCPANMVYFDCANASLGAKGAECQKTCQTLDMECFSIQCASGCVCPEGLVLNNNGKCVSAEECPCIHNGNIYHSGESILQDCNTCTCKGRKWKCTKKECHRTCVVYGEGHYMTFDGKRFGFSGDCEYTLTQDYCASNPGNGSFRIITENIQCGTTGATCSKAIKVFLGNFELRLSEGSFEVVERDIGGEVPYQIRMMGIYLVIEAKNGLIVMWDKKTSILIKLSPEFKGKVCGLCGNYDGSVSNDFTTRRLSVVVNVQEFGNSWKASPTCPDAQPLRDPCIANPYRQTWSQKHCSIIMGSTFSTCHSKVDPTPYHEACVRDTCGCDTGGDCECYCTAVSAYATACSDAGICVSWRTPEICPMFCDYYNPEGECEWHYKPCGAPCLKTCRNPRGQCMNQLPGLEGCYPKCPKARPFFDEDIIKCVAQADCGCYGDDSKRYNVGEMVPTYKNCQSCICTKKGLRCQMDLRACYCYYGNMKFNYGDIIYNTTDGIGGCITAICSSNGTIHRSVYPCLPTTKAPTSTFHFDTTTVHAENTSTPGQASSTSVSCLEEVCKWSMWYDVTCPKYGENEGDFETFENIRNKGHTICKIPSQVECRAQKFPKIPIADLGQIIHCNTSVGLVCHNRDQFSQLCFNYEMRVLCCSYVPCGESITSPTSDTIVSTPFMTITSKSAVASTVQPEDTVSTELSQSTQSSSSIKATAVSTAKILSPTSKKPHHSTQETIFTTPCSKQRCSWTPWYDVHFPSIVNSDGDFETLENIRAAGNNICQKPEDIECRAERFPEENITDIGQLVTCNITHGLICNNKDQAWSFPICYNYKVKILCCSMEDCELSTTYVHSTIKDHTTEHLKETSVVISTGSKFTENALTSSTVRATSSPSTFHTDHTGQVTGTLFQTISTSSKSPKTTPGEITAGFSVSKMRTTLPSLSTSKTTMTHIPTVQTSALIKTTGRAFESLVTSKYVSGTTSTSQNHETTLSFSTTPMTHAPITEIEHVSTEKSTNSFHSTSQEGDHANITVPQTSKVTTSRAITNSEISCVPVCQWSQWFDVSFPNLDTNGDFETYEEIKKSGFQICQEPSDIQCRSADLPGFSLEELQQNVQCNLSYGLVCQNEDQTGPFPYCYNYEIRVLCCSGCASTKVLPTFTDHQTSKIPQEDHKTTQKTTSSQVHSSTETGKLTTFEEIHTYAPLSTKTTKVLTAPMEMTTTKPTMSTILEVLSKSATSKETGSMATEVFTTLPTKTLAELSSQEPSKLTTAVKTENWETTSHKTVPIKTTKPTTIYGEVTTKATSPKVSTASDILTTEYKHEESTSHRTSSIKTTKISTLSSKLTSAYKSTSSKSTTKKAASPNISTVSQKTTESEHKKSTTHGLISIKTTKLSTESGEVTSVHKSTSRKPITTKATSQKVSTASRASTTKSEHEISTSHGPVSIKTTKTSTESGEVTYIPKSTSSKPITTKETSQKVSTVSRKSTTESEHEKSTSHGPVSSKTTKTYTESGEMTSVHKFTSRKPITTKATSQKLSTVSRKSTTESEHEKSTSNGPVSGKITKTSTESGEVTYIPKSTSSKPITTKATSQKVSTVSRKSTTESEHEKSTSHGPVSGKTTKISTESGEVTSVHKSTPRKPITTKATSQKVSTVSRKSTTESEHVKSTSHGPVSGKTTKSSMESGEVTSIHKSTPRKPITTKAASQKVSTVSRKSTTESEHEKSTSNGPVSGKITKTSTESGEVTSVHKSTSRKPITTKVTSEKVSTVSHELTTEAEYEKSTSHGPVSVKTTETSTESGDVTSFHKSTSRKPITTKATSQKVSTVSRKSTTESEHETSTSHGPVSIKTTKTSTESGEVTSVHKSTPRKPITTKSTSQKVSTVSRKSTTESEHEKSTSHGPVSGKTTKTSTESGEVTSVHNKPITTKATSQKVSTVSHKSTTESEHEKSTSHGPVSGKTTKTSTESGEVTSVHKSTSRKPITTKATSQKVSTVSRKSTTESEHEKSTSHGPVSGKTTKTSTESGEVTSVHKSTSRKPITTKATSQKVSTVSRKSTTESEHEKSTSHGPVSGKTTKTSTESGEVTSVHKSTSRKPITTKATSQKVSTVSHELTTEAEYEKSTSHGPVSVKTTETSTESGEVTYIPKSTSSKPITTKATSQKVSTVSHELTTEAEYEKSTSHGPVSVKTTETSTESGEVTYIPKSTSSKPIITKATSQKVSTVSHELTTEAEYEKSTSHGPVSVKTTETSTESGEVTYIPKSTSSKPITTKATSQKVSTVSRKSTTESEHEKSTSHGPVSGKTTKTSTESGEVTSVHKSTSRKPITTKATSQKVSTVSRKSTTESEHEKSTSHGPVSGKTTKTSTESGEVTSVHKSTSRKPITTKATSQKVSTVSRKSTTESEHEKSTSHGPVSGKTTKTSTESGEVTSVHKSTSRKPITTKATSQKVSTVSHELTTEAEYEESTSHGPVSVKTTETSTESGEVTYIPKSTSSKPIITKATSQKVSTVSRKSTTESEHEKSTSHGPVSGKTTKTSTESGEVTSVHKSTSRKPITTKATSQKVSTVSRKSTTESEHEKSTSHGPVSGKTTKTSTESGEVTSVHKSTSRKPITTKATSQKVSTVSRELTTEAEYEKSTSHGPVSVKTTETSTESGEVTYIPKSTSSKPIITKATSQKVSTVSHELTTEAEYEKSTSHGPVSVKTTETSTESGEVTYIPKSTSSKPIITEATSQKVSTVSRKSTTESVHEKSTSHGPVSGKTTKTSTESGEVTSVHKSTSRKPITTKATSQKVSTVSHELTTEAEYEKSTSHGPVSVKTTETSTESGEVTYIPKSTSSKPIITEATSQKVSTVSRKSTTESVHEKSTSHGPVSGKTTKTSTKSGEVTSVHKSTSRKPITTKATSQKVSTASRKSTTESEHEKSTSHGPVSGKTTKTSTESGEVTSVHKSTSRKPITTKATSQKVSTVSRKSTTESEHEKSTSHGPVSGKTTKTSTESGEVTSVHKSTSRKPITTKATSQKVSTVSHELTTEAEYEKSTSHGPVSVKTTETSTESGEVTYIPKSTSSKPIITEATSQKVSTVSRKSTTESVHEKSTSHGPVSGKTTKTSTKSGEVTSVHKSTSRKPITTKATSQKVSTASRASTTESEHEKSTSHGPVSDKTTKISTESGEVTSVHKSTPRKPITTKATSQKLSTVSRKSTTESKHEKSTSLGPFSLKTTKMSTESGEVKWVHKSTSRKPITTKATSQKVSTATHESTTESKHEKSTSLGPFSLKTTKMSTESGEVTWVHKSTSSRPITTKAISHKVSTAAHEYSTESEHEKSTSHRPISVKTTSMGSRSTLHTGRTAATTREQFSSQQPKSTKQLTSSTFGRYSTERTVTKTSRLNTAATESFSTTRCMCNFNGTIVPPGEVLYSTTDNDGWCFYARCNEKCQVERYSEHCYTVPTVTSNTKTAKTVTASAATTVTGKTGRTTKTSARSTKTAQTKTSASSVSSGSTSTPECYAVMPPRRVNETWMMDKCTHATCIGQNNIVVNKKQCAPVNEVACANRLKPKKTLDESGCCYQQECECVCGGWGTSHYITFDGTYYSFNGQCTYILVQQITPVFDHFWVYIDNFSCDPDDPSCVKTLRIMYKNDMIVLTSQSLSNRITNKIYINNKRVYPAIHTNGITITSSGIFVIVQIPEIGAYISFNVLSFTVKLPISKFSGNTEGHCGKCSNNQVDDCILPNGQQASSCTEMAGQWGIPSQDSSSCISIPTRPPTIGSQSTPFSSLPSTYFSTLLSSVPQTLPTIVPSKVVSLPPSPLSTAVQTTEEPCNTPELCKVILSSVFEECHNVVPPEPFYQACVSDGCIKTEGEVLCSSLQSYARLCGIEGVCIDWRDSTNGVCPKNCSSHLVYKPCGPAVEPTCNYRYNDDFYNKTTDFLEGCYCPEGSTKFNTISNKCVTTCGCTGPDGMPREPGETWESNCRTCICDNATMSVQCAAKSCAKPIPASCTEGSMSVSVPDSSNPCCQITECRCNISLCSNVKMVCKPGYEAELQTDAGGCCPVFKCVPKAVCVHNGSEYQPGGIVPSLNPCEKCMCDGTMNETSGMHPVTCTTVMCSIKCAQGFRYQKVPEQCCGTCVQTQCIMDLPDNSTSLLSPGETLSPPGDNCTEYECVRKKDKFVTVASKRLCPKINLDDCVPGTIQKDSKGCCLTCFEETNKCQKVKTEEIILQNGCKSLKPVVMSYCKGSCESYSRYSKKSQSIEHKCGCCQETKTEMVTINLSCPNGEIMKYNFINVMSCSCADSTCNKKKQEGSEEDPHVTNLIPQTTVKVIKGSKSPKDRKDHHTKNKKYGSESTENEKSEQNSSDEEERAKPKSQTNDKMVTKVKQATDRKDQKKEDSKKSKSNESGEKENKSDEKKETKPVSKPNEKIIQVTKQFNNNMAAEKGKKDSNSEETHGSKPISQTNDKMVTKVQQAADRKDQKKEDSKKLKSNESGEKENKSDEKKETKPVSKPNEKIIQVTKQFNNNMAAEKGKKDSNSEETHGSKPISQITEKTTTTAEQSMSKKVMKQSNDSKSNDNANKPMDNKDKDLQDKSKSASQPNKTAQPGNNNQGVKLVKVPQGTENVQKTSKQSTENIKKNKLSGVGK
ncbi:PREDICTED: mucin-5AC-like [Nanorana parkeri]|uniref:mucin-5AC-like n=1 Tax=Nanorana parkeri TaxID=125878 RepID=UPI0008542557|nr:PREDICTED: mucin-5AC-like [Nanorana parkeri]